MRDLLSRLGQGEATVGELAQPLEMSLPAVTKHIRVLSRARLIHQGRDSRWRPCRLETAPLLAASAWLEGSITLVEIPMGTRVVLRHLFPTQAFRDEVVEKYGAIEGGKSHLAKLEAYIRSTLA